MPRTSTTPATWRIFDAAGRLVHRICGYLGSAWFWLEDQRNPRDVAVS